MLEDFSSKLSSPKILLKSELSEFWESCYYLLDIFVQKPINKALSQKSEKLNASDASTWIIKKLIFLVSDISDYHARELLIIFD